MGNDLQWEVVLPERASVALGQRRPRAKLSVTTTARGTEIFSLPLAVGKRLAKGLEVGDYSVASRGGLHDLVADVERTQARARVEGLVNRRDYSTHELSQKLRDDGYPSSVVEEVVDRYRGCGILDDGRFAEVFVRSKIGAGWGQVRIARELERRGIEAVDIPGWPDEFFGSVSDERERAYDLASRRRLTGKNDYEKIVRFLMGRGFAVPVAKDVARRILEEARADD